MARLTVSNKLFPNGEQMLKGYSDKYVQAMANKLSNLEDIEDELGIDLVIFLKECKYVLEHCNTSEGFTSKGVCINTDFGYVEEFLDEMKKALTKEELL